jgi:predicted peroxiredoxin
MALQMADKASAAGDRDVFVYFDIKGVELVVEGFPEINFEGFPSSRVLLSRLQERGVPMAACPSCLRVISRTPTELISGVQTASLDAFFGFTKGRILTLDY